MRRDEAVEAIRESLARESATPTLGTNDREAYLRAQAASLLEDVIDPLAANVLGSTYEHGLTQVLGNQQSYVVARRDNQWLGFIPSRGEFFLAYGPAPDQLTAWGFSSDDALAEWLG